MKGIPFRSLKVILICVVLLGSMQVFSQSPFDGVSDDVNDETAAASIDLLLYLGLVAGSFLGIKKLKNNYQSKN
ncbi:hypothetical protein [Mesonia mobilis]|uniref:hypothetical protein n=1 Tax=Mesonia mobilis TaxID=369791 RepID=UPI0026F0ECCE|nr:hypothetical protein [Mesonia mobilis]